MAEVRGQGSRFGCEGRGKRTGLHPRAGTLRFLLWTAALLSPRPPELMVLNEPETSLHPDLLPALARLIAGAAKWVWPAR
ncbi:MAG TPA: AAA family ATPase [Acidobacteriaceae bacterium]|nr:AAA family ATPase [Acidobacteriaceae bacterium]